MYVTSYLYFHFFTEWEIVSNVQHYVQLLIVVLNFCTTVAVLSNMNKLSLSR